MALIIADRVKDTTTTTGTGDITLSGTPDAGFRAFSSVAAVGDNLYYCIAGGTDWEVGYGSLTGTTTLNRSRVIASSNSNALVNLASGTKDVFMTIPATIVQGRGSVWATANGIAIN